MASHCESKTAIVLQCIWECLNNCCRAKCLPDAGRVCNNHQAGATTFPLRPITSMMAWNENQANMFVNTFKLFSKECKHDVSFEKLQPILYLQYRDKCMCNPICKKHSVKAKCSGGNKMHTIYHCYNHLWEERHL